MTGILACLVGGSASFTVGVTPPSAYGISGSPFVISNGVSAIPTPSGAYTYSWVYLFGDTMAATDPTLQTTQFSASMGSGETRNAAFACDVTKDGVTVRSDIVTATLERT